MRAHEFITELGSSGQRKFKKSPCTKDCSGHSAGYNWATKRNLKNPNQCPTTPSRSFNNGCKIKGREEQPVLSRLWNMIRGRED